MVNCPECGHQAPPEGDWFRPVKKEFALPIGVVLIVCPSCDSILGGTAANHPDQ